MKTFWGGKFGSVTIVFGLVLVFLILPTGSVWCQQEPELKHPLLKHSWMRWDKEYWPTKPVRGGYLHYAASKYIGLMNPHHWPVHDWGAIGMFYEQLVYVDGSYEASVPWIVRTWEYEDPQTAVTTIQKGIRFFDNAVLDAHAIKANMDWIVDRNNGAWTRTYFKLIESVEVVDDYTIRWRFNKPWGGFMGALNYMGYIISPNALKGDVALRNFRRVEKKFKLARNKAAKAEKKARQAVSKGAGEADRAIQAAEQARKKVSDLEKEYVELELSAKGARDLDVYPVGTGAYMLEEGRPGNYLKLKRNPDWWFGKLIGQDMPFHDGVQSFVIPDPAIQLANLRAGKIDMMGVSKAQYPLVQNDPKLNVYVSPQPHTSMIRFNHAKGPCQDIRVRQAISHAIDRKALIFGTQHGLGREASGIYPGDHHCHNPSLQPVTYDPKLSRKLLAEAGFPEGLTIKGYADNNTDTMTLTEAVKAMLAQVGITWQVDFLDTVAASDRLKNLEYDAAMGGWIYIFNPDSVATGLYHPKGGFNFGRTRNDRATALVDAGLEETDRDKRIKIYQELDRVLYDNYEDAWLYWYISVTAHRKVIQGYNHKLALQGREGYDRSHHTWFKDGRR